jgi:hypothetical protein
MHTPTPEQQAAIDAFATTDDLVLSAGAGAGKTSTLRMLAETAPRRRGMYITYGKAIADEAAQTFPRQVRCSTAHSLAFRAVGFQYKDRLGGSRQPARVVANILGIDTPIDVGGDMLIAPQQAARLAMGAVRLFCTTADPKIEPFHVKPVNGFEKPEVAEALRDQIADLARKAWTDLTSTRGQLKFTHDHYLKIWQLSYPKLPTDYVLLDEAQDADPVIASIVGNQQCQRIAVGDEAQAIYEWRGAINAMAKWPGKRLHLTKSFRFGPAVAHEANKWLEALDAPLRITGHDPIPTRIATLAEPQTILTRSNAGAIREVIASLAQGRRTALVGGGTQIRSLAAAAVSLKAGAGTDHPELFAFQTWNELREYVQQDQGGADLKTFVALIEDFGPDAIISALDRLVEEPKPGRPRETAAQVTVSTAHKAKGLEWSTVRIGDDFHEPRRDEDGYHKPVNPGEARLAYVAVTRAKDTLDRGALAWIDNYNPR